MIHSPERVEAIRSRSTSGIQSISALLEIVSDSGMRGQLQQLRYWFADVQTFFIGGLAREDRTSEAEAVWLTHADMVLEIADKQLEELVAIVDQHRKVKTSRG